jgi:hypothetical protein
MRNQRKTFFNTSISSVILLLIISALFSSCDMPKRYAVGIEDEIIVVADSAEYFQLEAELLAVFGKQIYTPQGESLFSLRRKDFINLGDIQNRKNIIIAAPLNSETYPSQYISSILDSNVRGIVDAGEEFVFNKYDLWARNQLVMILTGRNIEEMKSNILNESENLLYYFQKLSNKRLKRNLYSEKYEKKEIQGQLLKEHGWVMYVQADFHLALNKPDDNFVWLRRAPGSDMERWVFVHWIENASPRLLDKDSVTSIRQAITEKFYRTSDDSAYVEITPQPFRPIIKEVNFLDRYALMSQGFWRFSDKSGGGPFVNYTFYDEDTKRLYMLDGSIYAPKYYKKKLIQQVDVLLQSFMTEAELTEDRRDELLSAIGD